MKFLFIILFATCLVFAFWQGLRSFEDRNLYYPDRILEAGPADYGFAFDDIVIDTADGEKIHGWFIPGAAATIQSEKSTPSITLLYCHGNGGNISDRLEKARIFRGMEFDVFLFDYRGYGKSEGKPSEQGTYADAEAAFRYLTENRRIPPQSIVFYGESLGGGVAVEMACRHPVRGLILENAFTSTVQMARIVFPWLPAQWIVRHRYDNLSKIPSVKIPILFLHTREDEVIPFRMGQELFSAATGEKKLVELSGDHNGAYLMSGRRYVEALESFLSK